MNYALIPDAFRQRMKPVDIISSLGPLLDQDGGDYRPVDLIFILQRLVKHGGHLPIPQRLTYSLFYRGILLPNAN
jgi:hypothetical protein